jgi:hypothetical protein
MNFLRLLPVILSCVLLAAHFSRNGVLLLSLVSLTLPFLLLVRKSWVPRFFQVVLVLGALEWVRRLVALAFERRAAGDEWLRMALILGAVAAFTAASALAFRSAALKDRYGVKPS